jgi:DNA-binding NarL/FixJ family response regulator
VTQGLGNREIAEHLMLAKRMVDSHIEHIFNKLGFTSRAQIAAWLSRQD